MRKVGFPISTKENESRRVLIPRDIINIKNKEMLYFEKGYGKVLGISDEEYIKAGANVASKNQVLEEEVLCDCKIGDSSYLKKIKDEKVIFGWIHAVQNPQLTDILLDSRSKVIAWEDMFYKGRHIFWRNNEIAGEAAVMNAYSVYGKFPYETKVAILGRGNVARGAYRILNGLGADITVYGSRDEELFREEMGLYDVIVNGILWDINREDHIIYRKDLNKMKKGSMIIDVSCDANKGIETSNITTIKNPVYYVDGVLHYVVNHTPSIFYKTATASLSKEVSKYIDDIIEEREEKNKVLKKAIIINNGSILDHKIIDFQNRKDNNLSIA